MTHGIGGGTSALMGAEELGKNSSCGLKIVKQLFSSHFAAGNSLDGSKVFGRGSTSIEPLVNGLLFNTDEAGKF